MCFIVTSDTVYRGLGRDRIREVIDTNLSQWCSEARIIEYRVLPNSIDMIRSCIQEYIERCDIIVVTGGTGLSSRDVSIEAVKSLATKELPGFGEFFRLKSYELIGPRALLSRASAFIVDKSLVFVVPGNPQAVELALKDIICRIAPHAVYELHR